MSSIDQWRIERAIHDSAAGEGLTIRYGSHPSPFGECQLAVTRRGVCALGFRGSAEATELRRELQREWPGARLVEDHAATGAVLECIFGSAPGDGPLPLLVQGTNFQIRVWEALLELEPGEVTSYGGLAMGLGMPRAARAVGSAVGANRIAYLIPCHRVIRGSGLVGGYRWGSERKEAMLAYEAARPKGEPLRRLIPEAAKAAAERPPSG